MSNQPVPAVTDADVDRIVRRDFPSGVIDEALAMLQEYGVEDWEREAARVRLDILKLAEGKIDRLRANIRLAKMDYRDVIAAAEYPAYCKHVPPSGGLAPSEVRRIIDEDWDQYLDWLNK